MRRGADALLVLACCGAALACSTLVATGSRYAKSQLVVAATGGVVTVTESDDPRLAGVTVRIPPGALSKDTVITIAEASPLALPSGAAAVGHAVELGPAAAAFAHPVTITLPYRLSAGQAVSALAVQGLAPEGTTIRVSRANLVVELGVGALAFTSSRLITYGALVAPAGGAVCQAGEALCGCCGNGVCLPEGQPCTVSCAQCSDGGITAGDGDGGTSSSCCPAGELFCGCAGSGVCLPAGTPCTFSCASTSPMPTCCSAGTYLCGCGGVGVCLPTDQVCALTCPDCPGATIPSACGCLAAGETCAFNPSGHCAVAEWTWCCGALCVPPGFTCPAGACGSDGGP